jgi:hypothetical protein
VFLHPQVILIDLAGTTIEEPVASPFWQMSWIQIRTLHYLAYERASE